MAKAQQTQVVITANASTAKKVMDELQRKIDAITKKMNSLDTTTKQGQKEFAKLEKEMVSYNSAVAENVTNTERINKAMNNLSGSTLGQLKRALAACKSEMNKMSEAKNMDGIRTMRNNIQTLQGQIDKLSGTVKKSNSTWQTAMKNMTAYFGAFQMFSMATNKVKEFISMNLKLSDQLADIRKVSGLAMSDINNLSGELAKIDTRTSQSELNSIAYAGAKLGMGKYGVEGLKQFTEAANQVNVALKEDLGADALTALSKITETMGLIPKMGVEKAMLATGSAMFKLSSTSTATSNNIVEFSKRLTGVASTAGITTDQLLAMGSAADSMYLMPEVASTAMGKLIVALQKNHNLIAKQLGIPDETIKSLYSTGHAMDALVLIFEKMKEKGNMNALAPVFKDLGSDGQRLITATVTMAKNVDMLKEHLYTSKEAFEEADAVTQEYNIQQNTANALVERANNLWVKAFINPQGVDNVRSMAQAWYNLSSTLTKSPIFTGTAQAAIWILIKAFQVLLPLIPTIATFFMMRGVAQVWVMLSQSWGVAKVALIALKNSYYEAAAGQTALNVAQKANIFGAIATLVITVVSAIASYVQSTKEAAENTDKWAKHTEVVNEGLRSAALETSNLEAKMKGYMKAMQQTNISQQTRQDLIKKFNIEFGGYIKKLGIEIKTVGDLAKSYRQLAEEIQRKSYYEQREKDKDTLLPKFRSDELDALQKYRDFTKSGTFSGFSSKWVKDMMDKGANAQGVYQHMIEGVTKGSKFKFNGANYTYSTASGGTGSGSSKELLSILQYYYNARNRTKGAENYINQRYSDYVPDDYHPWTDDDLGTLDNNAKDKAGDKATKAAAAAQRKEWRQQLKEAQDQANAIIDKIKDYYERQITEVLKIANDTEMDETLQTQLTNALKKRENASLAAARKAITGTADEWNKFKEGMDKDVVGPAGSDNVVSSKELLGKIDTTDLPKLRNLIAQLSKNLGRPEGGFWDEIRKNATLNEKGTALIDNKTMKARRQAELEDNYTGKVNKDYEDKFYQFDFATPSSSQMASILGGGTDEAAKVLQERSDAILKVFDTARKNIVNLYASSDRSDVLSLLFGPNWEQELQNSPLSGLLDLQGDDFKLFYDTLIKYSDDYTEAQKKAIERTKKINAQLWSFTGADKDLAAVENETSTEKKQRSMLFNNGKTTGQQAGFKDSIANDPEIQLLQAKIEYQKAYYDFLAAHQADEQTLLDQQNAIREAQLAYTEEMTNQVKERISLIQQWTQPVEEMGASVGEALGTMVTDAESGREALGDALKSILQQWGQLAIQLITDNLNKQVQQSLTNQEMEEEEQRHQDAMAEIDSDGGKQNTKITRKLFRNLFKIKRSNARKEENLIEDSQETQTDIVGANQEAQSDLETGLAQKTAQAVISFGQQKTSAQVEQSATSASANIGEAQVNTAAGIAGGSAKTIESLGWWGIPLVAVLTALLEGLLSFALSQFSSIFGGGSSTAGNSANVNTKLVSGMLTYDEGNVQSFVGSDGKVYAARDAGALPSGVSMVNSPIATTVNGVPSLVGEKGPEIVVGRETTAAMMQNAPALLSMLASFDKNHTLGALKTFDDGNVSDSLASGDISGALDSSNSQMTELMQSMLFYLQNPVAPNINMYGRGGLQNKMTKANSFMNNR